MSKTIPMWSQDYPTWTLRVGSSVALIVRRVKRSAAFRGDDEFAWAVGMHQRKGPAEWLHRGVATTIFDAQRQAEKAMSSVRMLFNAPVRWERLPGMGENRMWRRPAGHGYLYVWVNSLRYPPDNKQFGWEVWTGARGAPSGTAPTFKEAAAAGAAAYRKHLEKGGATLFNARKNADPRFEALADAQRGKPEGAMMRLQMANISQLYGATAEHVGDLTHRMSQKIDFFKGGYQWVEEKVRKTLRWLTNPYGFEREVKEQVVTNFNYMREHGDPYKRAKHFGRSPQDALLRLKRLGRLYAAEHRKLPVFNAVQRIARAAAIAVGEWRFKDAVDRLYALRYLLDQGYEAWSREAMKTKNSPKRVRKNLHVDLPTSDIFTASPYGLSPNRSKRHYKPRKKPFFVARFRPPYPQKGEFWTVSTSIDTLPATVVGGVYKVSAPSRVSALAQARMAHARGR